MFDSGPSIPSSVASRDLACRFPLGRGPREKLVPFGALKVTGQVLLEMATVGIIVAAVLLFFRENLAHNTIYYENDTRVFYYPVMSDLAESVKTGKISMWSPYLLTGFPLFADGESGALYPINLLLLAHVPIDQAFVWLTVIRFILAAVFMYAYARSLRLARSASCASAAVFSFGGFSVAQMHHMNLVNSAAWLPLILFFFELAMRARGYLRHLLLILSGMALAASSLGVHVQVVLMILLLLGLYVPFRIFFFSTRRRQKKVVIEDPLHDAAQGLVPRPGRNKHRDEVSSPLQVAGYQLGSEGGGSAADWPASIRAIDPLVDQPKAEVAEQRATDDTTEMGPKAKEWPWGRDGTLYGSSDNGKAAVRHSDQPVAIRPEVAGKTGIAAAREQPIIGGVLEAAGASPEEGLTVQPDGWWVGKKVASSGQESHFLAKGFGRAGPGRWREFVLGVGATISAAIVRLAVLAAFFSDAGDRAIAKGVYRTLAEVRVFLICLGHRLRGVLGPWSLLRLASRAIVAISLFVDRLLGKTVLAIWAGGVILIVGLGLAAAQLLPEYELANFSFRAGSVPYSFAVSYALTPFNLITILFPFFFVDRSGTYWGLWSAWETAHYVGIMPLFLAAIAVLCARTRHAIFFAIVTVLSLIVAMGDYIPWNLHRWLYELPGFGQMRVPARFSFLFTFSMATLTGIGLNWLILALRPARLRRAIHPLRALFASASTALFSVIIILAVPVSVAIPFMMNWFSGWLRDNKTQALDYISKNYLALRNVGQPMKADQVYGWLLNSLSLDEKKVILSVGLIAGSAILLLFWDRFRRLSFLWRIGVVLVICVDLYFFAKSFHPLIPVEALAAPSPAATFLQQTGQDGRVYIGPRVTRDQSNRLLLSHLPELGGYSSLEFQRHNEYIAHYEVIDNSLLDLANVRYVVRQDTYVPLPSYLDTSFNPLRPLFSASSGNTGARTAFLANGETTTEVRLVGNLTQAADIPQGAKVGEITVTDTGGITKTQDIIAGVHFAEGFYSRPDYVGKLQHQQPTVAFNFPSLTSSGFYTETLYLAKFPLGSPQKPSMNVKRVEIRFTYPSGKMHVHGLALFDGTTWQAKNLRRFDNERYRLVYDDDQVLIYENRTVLPRTFLVPTAAKVSSDMRTLWRIADGDFDPQKVVLLEGEPDLKAMGVPEWTKDLPVKTGATLGTAQIVENTAEKVVVTVDAKDPSFLFLADSYYPGWQVYVDGKSEQVYRADYLYRAVYAPAGKHTIEFQFEPKMFEYGTQIGLWVLPIMVGLAVAVFIFTLTGRGVAALLRWLWRRARRRPGPIIPPRPSPA